ncbi:hypothetical protein ON010_g10112 [Phytophthora cinnamomi]|nr:hypothetical protein ON010_g10112 [Phytophthora cinnamomi]
MARRKLGDDEFPAGKSTTSVKFAATDAAGRGGLSDEVVAVIAAVAAFAAVVVAAVAVVLARNRRTKEEVDEEEGEEGEEDEEDKEDADSSADEEEQSAADEADEADEADDEVMAVPPTPMVVTGKMATTPTAAANRKAKTPKTTPVAAETSAETTLSSSSPAADQAEVAGDDKASEETAASPKDAVACEQLPEAQRLNYDSVVNAAFKMPTLQFTSSTPYSPLPYERVVWKPGTEQHHSVEEPQLGPA